MEDAYKIVAKDLNDNPYERATGGLMPKKTIPFFAAISIVVILVFGCTREKKVVEVSYGPVLYDLVAPDSLQKGAPGLSYIFVTAFDLDGLADIDSVYFIVTRPDSTSNGLHFALHDDGQNGDSTSNDGRFSIGIQAPAQENQSGNYIFTFYAKDKQGNDSNHPKAYITAY